MLDFGEFSWILSRFGTPSFVKHFVQHGWFLQFLGWGNKKLLPQRFCWDRRENPAVPPGLARCLRPLNVHYHAPAFGHGVPLRLTYSRGMKSRPVSDRPRKSIQRDPLLLQFHHLQLSGRTVLSPTHSFSTVFLHSTTRLSSCQGGTHKNFFSPPTTFTIDSPLQKTDVV